MKKFKLYNWLLLFLSATIFSIWPSPILAQMVGPKVYVYQASDCSFLTWYGALCQDTDDGKLYKWNGATQVELAAGGATSPGGATTNVQFNNTGAFDGDAEFTWNTSTKTLTVNTGGITVGNGGVFTGALTGNATTATNALPPTVQSVTCTDSGDGNPGTLTITPTVNLSRVDISLTVNDAHGCTITMAETGAVEETLVIITNISAANTATFTTSANVLTLKYGSPYVVGAKQSLLLLYKGSEWLEAGRTGDITGISIGGLTASKGACSDADGKLISCTNLTDVTPVVTIASGSTALDFASTATGACATVIQAAATGVATTDVIIFTPNASIKAVTGYVPASTGGFSITAFPTANYVNFEACNWTAGTVDPGSITVNWRVIR